MVSLPNIIANKIIVPQILQGAVKVENITYEIERLLYERKYRDENIRELSKVKALLSDKVSSDEAAGEISRSLYS